MKRNTTWLFLALLVAFGDSTTWAGELDPPASALTPQGTPAPAMKSLDQVPGSWDRLLSAEAADSCNSERFKCVMNGTAVLDRETGLVWERSPNVSGVNWYGARDSCFGRTTGGRKGWRLPSLPELASLVQHDVRPPGPTLPLGHPFLNVVSGSYWTATGAGAGPGVPIPDPSLAAVFFPLPEARVVDTVDGDSTRSRQVIALNSLTWCVRGGSGGPDIQ